MFDAIHLFFINALKWIYSWVGNYGWSVVVFTVMIRLVLLPLTAKSRKGMRDMQRIQPKVQALQKKYANDKEKLQLKTMELYKKEHVSMSSGCLPLLLQYPVLIFMFRAMQTFANESTVTMILQIKEAIEAGTAPQLALHSWLWIKNVFQPDSFMATILPAAGSKLNTVVAAGFSNVLTTENIEAARTFLTTPEYAAFAAEFGANQFVSLPINLGLAQFTWTVPTSLNALFQYANGLFILPLLAAASQFIMTKITAGQQKLTEEQKLMQQQGQQQAMDMNSGFMKWFFPLFSLWICASSNSAFAIYWMAVNVVTIVETVALNKIFDMQDARREAEALTEAR